MKERGEGRPQEELTTENTIKQKQDERGWYERQHKKLVKKLQDYVEKQEKVFGEYLTREEIIRMYLNFEEESGDERIKAFFAPLRRAWDVLAYERYEPGSSEEHQSGILLSRLHRYYRESTIRLSDPLQVKVIDALTEVCAIPHVRGQAEIEIPEKLRDYDRWILSTEYQEKLGKARAERKRKGEERYMRLHAEPPKLQT
jgi:hypothetical protein